MNLKSDWLMGMLFQELKITGDGYNTFFHFFCCDFSALFSVSFICKNKLVYNFIYLFIYLEFWWTFIRFIWTFIKLNPRSVFPPILNLLYCCYHLKGIVHPKMKILSLITHPHVVPNLKDLHSSSEHKLRYFWWNLRAFCPSIDSNGTTTFKAQKCERTSKFDTLTWQNFHVWVNYPFKRIVVLHDLWLISKWLNWLLQPTLY